MDNIHNKCTYFLLRWTAFRNKEYTQDLLRKWYTDRAYEIERDSRLVDNALALVNIGKSHNISGLEKLLFELETLDDLVYKVGLEDLSLTEVEKKNDFEKVNLLMKNSNEDDFVEHIKNLLLPYSRRKKRYFVSIFINLLVNSSVSYCNNDQFL